MDRAADAGEPDDRPATAGVVDRVSDLIGFTPLSELGRSRNGARLLLKLEQFNPTGSAKIRMARQMVLAAEDEGSLRPGGWIVGSTSGNTGLGLAVIAAERGYRFTAVVDHHAPKDKLRAMQAMGVDLIYVADDGDENLATAAREDLAARIAKDADDAIFTEQHNNPANAVGYEAVADEILAALPGGMDVLIGPVGTGGSLCGTARRIDQLDRTRSGFRSPSSHAGKPLLRPGASASGDSASRSGCALVHSRVVNVLRQAPAIWNTVARWTARTRRLRGTSVETGIDALMTVTVARCSRH